MRALLLDDSAIDAELARAHLCEQRALGNAATADAGRARAPRADWDGQPGARPAPRPDWPRARPAR